MDTTGMVLFLLAVDDENKGDNEEAVHGGRSQQQEHGNDNIMPIIFPKQIGTNDTFAKYDDSVRLEKSSSAAGMLIRRRQQEERQRFGVTTDWSSSGSGKHSIMLDLDSQSTPLLLLAFGSKQRSEQIKHTRNIATDEIVATARNIKEQDDDDQNESSSPSKEPAATKANKWKDRLAKKRQIAAEKDDDAKSQGMDAPCMEDSQSGNVPTRIDEKKCVPQEAVTADKNSEKPPSSIPKSKLKTPTSKAQKWKDRLATKKANDEKVTQKRPVSHLPAFQQQKSPPATTQLPHSPDKRSNHPSVVAAKNSRPISLLPTFEPKISQAPPNIKAAATMAAVDSQSQTTTPLSPKRPSLLPTLKTTKASPTSPPPAVVPEHFIDEESAAQTPPVLLLPALDNNTAASVPSTPTIPSGIAPEAPGDDAMTRVTICGSLKQQSPSDIQDQAVVLEPSNSTESTQLSSFNDSGGAGASHASGALLAPSQENGTSQIAIAVEKGTSGDATSASANPTSANTNGNDDEESSKAHAPPVCSSRITKDPTDSSPKPLDPTQTSEEPLEAPVSTEEDIPVSLSISEANSLLCLELLKQELHLSPSDVTDTSSLLMENNSNADGDDYCFTERNIPHTVDTVEPGGRAGGGSVSSIRSRVSSSSSKTQKWKDRLVEKKKARRQKDKDDKEKSALASSNKQEPALDQEGVGVDSSSQKQNDTVTDNQDATADENIAVQQSIINEPNDKTISTKQDMPLDEAIGTNNSPTIGWAGIPPTSKEIDDSANEEEVRVDRDHDIEDSTNEQIDKEFFNEQGPTVGKALGTGNPPISQEIDDSTNKREVTVDQDSCIEDSTTEKQIDEDFSDEQDTLLDTATCTSPTSEAIDDAHANKETPPAVDQNVDMVPATMGQNDRETFNEQEVAVVDKASDETNTLPAKTQQCDQSTSREDSTVGEDIGVAKSTSERKAMEILNEQQESPLEDSQVGVVYSNGKKDEITVDCSEGDDTTEMDDFSDDDEHLHHCPLSGTSDYHQEEEQGGTGNNPLSVKPENDNHVSSPQEDVASRQGTTTTLNTDNKVGGETMDPTVWCCFC